MSQVLSAVMHRKLAGLICGEPKAWSAQGVVHLNDGPHTLEVGPSEDVCVLQALWEKHVDAFLANPSYEEEIKGWSRNA